jgi:hypothetical protein
MNLFFLYYKRKIVRNIIRRTTKIFNKRTLNIYTIAIDFFGDSVWQVTTLCTKSSPINFT